MIDAGQSSALNWPVNRIDSRVYFSRVLEGRIPVTTTSPQNSALDSLLAGPPPGTITDVLAQLQALDSLLAVNDGLKWFNRLYLMVTGQVHLNPPGGSWQNPAWLEHLDVVFAGFYFEAIRCFLAGEPLPSAWNAVFEARFDSGIDRVQFAVGGMNAHINRDLALALLQADADLKLIPPQNGPEHQDYQAVNVLLRSIMPSALAMLAGDTLGMAAEESGQVGRLLAFWDICQARDLAWNFANHLRDLNETAYAVALASQDGLTGALGRAILTRI